MDDYKKQIEILQAELFACRRENQILKEILEEAGLPYKDRLEKIKPEEKAEYDPNQGARIKPLQITEDTANYFFQRFWGRKDVYELRNTNAKTGKTGYYTQCFNFWQNGCHKKRKMEFRAKIVSTGHISR